jgi:hypothetical protein
MFSGFALIEGVQSPVITFTSVTGESGAHVKDTPEMRRNIARQLRMLARKFEISAKE